MKPASALVDLKIAPIAIANEVILVSRNLKDARTSAGFNSSGLDAIGLSTIQLEGNAFLFPIQKLMLKSHSR